MPAAAVAMRRWACPPRLPGRSVLAPALWRRARCLATAAASPKPHYITTPIFYVNAAPHIGHLHSIVLADVAARWAAWRSGPHSRALLATGTDEHGLKIQRAASANSEDPAALCARVSGTFRNLASACGISEHVFIRTTEERHRAAVQALWRRLAERGHIYMSTHAGWYAVSDEAFYTAAQVRDASPEEGGSGKVSVETGTPVEWYEEANYKFRLGDFAAPLVKWLDSTPDAILPPSRHAEVLAELRTGLNDLSISRPRARLEWGIPVPDDPDHTIYVWVDALTNYLTVTGYPWAESGADEVPAGSAWPADAHVVGKDIVRFHAVYWPALLMAAGLPVPRHIVTHGHWTMNHSKMSKSRGNVADPFEMLQRFGVDEVRWFLMRLGGGLADDSNWSEATLREYYKKYLQGQLGNLLSRMVAPKVQARLFEGEQGQVIALKRPEPSPADEKLRSLLNEAPNAFAAHMAAYELAKALEVVSEVLAAANELVAHLEPWRPSADRDAVQRAQYMALEALRISSCLLAPSMPQRMAALQASLQLGADETTWASCLALRPEVRVERSDAKVAPLFPPLAEPVAEQKPQLSSAQRKKLKQQERRQRQAQ